MTPTLVTVTPTSLGAMEGLLSVWLRYWGEAPWWQLVMSLRPWVQCGPAYECLSPSEYPWSWLAAGGDAGQLPAMGEPCELVCEWKRVLQEHYPALLTSVSEFASALDEAGAKAVCLALGNGYDYYWAPILVHSSANGWADVVLPIKCAALAPADATIPRLPVLAPDDVYRAGRSRYAACRDSPLTSQRGRCILLLSYSPSLVATVDLCGEEELAGRLCAAAPTVRGEWMTYSEVMDRFGSYLELPLVGVNPLTSVIEYAGGAIVVDYDEVASSYESEAWMPLNLLNWSTTPGFY